MFGIGTWEWVLIIIIALVFLGPDKLPEVARSAGKGMRAVRRALRGLEEEVGPIARPLADLDPRRAFEDAVRAQTQGPRELAPEDLTRPEDPAVASEGGGPPEPSAGTPDASAREPSAREPSAREPSAMEMEPDGRVASGPPLPRPAPAAGPAPTTPVTPASEPDAAAGDTPPEERT